MMLLSMPFHPPPPPYSYLPPTNTAPTSPLTGIIAILNLHAGYLGLIPHPDSGGGGALPINDKALHLLTFFALTVAFYWVVDTGRRRTLNLTLAVCTAGLGVGSELLQAFLPNGRTFDVLDVAANLVGSLAGVGLCTWYHKRMLERKRLRKYTAVPTGEGGDGEEGEEVDLELGEGPGIGGGRAEGEHEEGVTGAVVTGGGGGGGQRAVTLEEQVDNWDENAVDAWDEDDAGDVGVAAPAARKSGEVGIDPVPAKKRAD
jgi:VanZ family protein